MKTLPWWFRAFVRTLGFLCPPAMVAIAWRMFWDLGKPMPISAAAREIQLTAARDEVSVNGRRAVVYRWGTGPNTIVLVHGWRGRASQFAAMIDALRSPERTIIAFDAPGNGDAPGTRTDLFDYIALIRSVSQGRRLDAIVGHSFGVLAVFAALRDDVRSDHIVSISGVSGFDYVVRTFAALIDLPARVIARLRHRIEQEIFTGDDGFWARYRSETEPTDRTPLLVVHDADDRLVDVSESTPIAEAHVGPTTKLISNRLGHTRVLSDPEIVEAVVSFVNAEARTRSAGA